MPIRFIRNREELEHEVITSYTQRNSIRSISRVFGIGRNTVRRILRRHKIRRDEGYEKVQKKIIRGSKLDPYIDKMKELLKTYPNITGVRMLEELRKVGYTGGKSILNERIRQLRPKPKRAPQPRFETDAGMQGQMDWSPYTIHFSKTGKQTVQCFSYILGFSRKQYIDFADNKKFFTLIRRHVDAFSHFGGVVRHCLYDNEKTVVLRWEAGRPVFNPGFIDFITHYQCRPVACKPGMKETKGKIERPFWYIESNLLNARTFIDLEDLRSCARWWLANKSDLHIHETTKRSPLELFESEEKQSLKPLPVHPYDCSEVALRVCSIDGFVVFETNRYSVPYEYVCDIVTLKATEQEIFIYSAFIELIAHHERSPNGACDKHENPAHRVSQKTRYGLEPVREAFTLLGEGAYEFIAGLKQKHPHHCGFHAKKILSMKERYNADDIAMACRHALRYRAFDSMSIERILSAKAIPRTLESIRNQKAANQLQKVLPEIKQRNLDEYGLFLNRKEYTNEEKGNQTHTKISCDTQSETY